MTLNSLLIFVFNSVHFAVNASSVRETVWLPELTEIEESPPYVVGIFSLRGQIVPVIDLNLRFAHPIQPYHQNDQVVVLECENVLIGLIVNEVCEVVEFPVEKIQPFPNFNFVPNNQAHLIAGEVRIGDKIVTLLEVKQLLQHPIADLTTERHSFFQQISLDDSAIYHARATALMNSVIEEEAAYLSLAVIELGGEYFAIELQVVQKFCNISTPREIPCCPPHILGVISLRGNLLTLLDISSILNLPTTKNSTKAIITPLKEQLVAIAVDKLNDVLYLREDALQSALALNEQHKIEIKGTVPYANKMIAVLDLPTLLARQEWIVDETCN